MEQPSFCDWLKTKGITNWVLHRRTPRIVQRYGDDVTCLSQKRYKALEQEYDAIYEAPRRRLAEAAPLAIEACRALVEWDLINDCPVLISEACSKARAAIAKAEGR